jgi:hypothetical protein
MSYCRWSSDDYQCDVYVWEDCDGGYRVCVAELQYVFAEPLPPPVSYEADGFDAWFARSRKVSAMIECASRKPIGLPRDGERYSTETASETVELLEDLKREGYNVPQYAIDALREETAETTNPTE